MTTKITTNISSTEKDTFAGLHTAPNILLTSFKRNEEGVGTPLGFALANGKLYFTTRDSTWKVKRMANNPRVNVAPCTPQGKPLGPAVEGRVRRLEGAEANYARQVMSSTLDKRLWGLMFLLIYKIIAPRDKWILYEVTPVE